MTSQHPTIPGCTVKENPGTRILKIKISPGRFVSDYSVIAVSDSGRMQANNMFFPPEHAETIAAMILDQAQWLREVGQ